MTLASRMQAQYAPNGMTRHLVTENTGERFQVALCSVQASLVATVDALPNDGIRLCAACQAAHEALVAQPPVEAAIDETPVATPAAGENWLHEMLATPATPSPARGICGCGHEGMAGKALCFICGSNQAHMDAITTAMPTFHLVAEDTGERFQVALCGVQASLVTTRPTRCDDGRSICVDCRAAVPISPYADALLLTYIAETYGATYPHEAARIARAVALVEAGNVTLLPDGTATVHSQKRQATYHVNGNCDCPDLAAKDGNCKHKFAKTFAKKLACLARKARYALYLDAATGEQVAGMAWPSLDEMQIWYAPEADDYPVRLWAVTAAQVVLLARLDA